MSSAPVHVLAKPSGAQCNLDCTYCFYLSRGALYPDTPTPRMSAAVVEAWVRGQLALHGPEDTVTFAWQGGEPTLMGLPFFEAAVATQARLKAPGQRVLNTLQTNGILLDDAWCAWLARHDVLVGLSVDGPARVHDRYRRDRSGRPTSARVEAAARRLRDHGVRFNVLATVSEHAAADPLALYRHLVGLGSPHIQLIPLVGQTPTGVTPWTVSAASWGRLLTTIFDHWIRLDVGRVFVRLFETQLGIRMGLGSADCVFAPTCGDSVALEHDGTVYVCDHFVAPEHALGSLARAELGAVLAHPARAAFGDAKRDALPPRCRSCAFLDQCHGECPKNRFVVDTDGSPGLNHLCAGYLRFFAHSAPYLDALAALLRRGRDPAEVCALVRGWDARSGPGSLPRKLPCPCGSGRRFRGCCGRSSYSASSASAASPAMS